MATTYSIVPAREEHASQIAQLSLELGYQTTVEKTKDSLAQLLASTKHFAVVACTPHGKLLGWAAVERRLTLEHGETVELTGLVVTHLARRSGVGSALVHAAEEWALKQGFSSIRVRSNINRIEAHSFYGRLGFSHSKTQHAYQKSLMSAI